MPHFEAVSTHTNYREALNAMVDTRPDKGATGFSVERQRVTDGAAIDPQLAGDDVYLFTVEDTDVDVFEVLRSGQDTQYIVADWSR